MTNEIVTGIERLKGAVAYDQEREPNSHDYQGKLDWIIDRAKHYEEKTGISYLEVIEKWEEKRDYWYMNYYQDCNQPLLTNEDDYVFDTVDDFKKAVGKSGFRCPKCEGISKALMNVVVQNVIGSPMDCLEQWEKGFMFL